MKARKIKCSALSNLCGFVLLQNVRCGMRFSKPRIISKQNKELSPYLSAVDEGMTLLPQGPFKDELTGPVCLQQFSYSGPRDLLCMDNLDRLLVIGNHPFLRARLPIFLQMSRYERLSQLFVFSPWKLMPGGPSHSIPEDVSGIRFPAQLQVSLLLPLHWNHCPETEMGIRG